MGHRRTVDKNIFIFFGRFVCHAAWHRTPQTPSLLCDSPDSESIKWWYSLQICTNYYGAWRNLGWFHLTNETLFIIYSFNFGISFSAEYDNNMVMSGGRGLACVITIMHSVEIEMDTCSRTQFCSFEVESWQTSVLFAAQNTMNATDSSVMFDDTAIATEAWITIVDNRLTWILRRREAEWLRIYLTIYHVWDVRWAAVLRHSILIYFAFSSAHEWKPLNLILIKISKFLIPAASHFLNYSSHWWTFSRVFCACNTRDSR